MFSSFWTVAISGACIVPPDFAVAVVNPLTSVRICCFNSVMAAEASTFVILTVNAELEK
jgi:hypothetical protein